jgi:adenylate cyclase
MKSASCELDARGASSGKQASGWGQQMSGEAPESREAQRLSEPTAAVQPPPDGATAAAVERLPRVSVPSTESIWNRIKRHKVVEWTLAYVAFGYALLHGVQMLRETFEWPLLVPRLTVFVLLVGVPVAATLAWYHGHRARHRISGVELSILIALLLIAGSVLWWASRMETTHVVSTTVADATHFNPPLGDKSIAVLPFVDLSEKKDQEYFADGMAEEMVDILARIPQLRVIGRVSSFHFKGQAEDLPTIGERLGAAYILTGSVRRGGPQIRVTAQLFEARSGAQLWAESYDREFGDVLALQDQIASNIARALQLAIVMDDAQELRRLKSPEAYALYLRGRSAYDRGGVGLREAQANFEQVLALEPKFPRVTEALALTHLALIANYMVPNRIGWQNAVDAANLTLRLDPKSALAHAILGLKLAVYDYDWAGAGQELDRALTAESRDPLVLYNCSWLAFDIGRVDEALHLQDAALSLDPLNPDSLQNGAIIHYLLGHFDLAERGFRKSLEVSPTFGGSHKYLGQILLLQGRPRAAFQEMETERGSDRDIGLALVYHALGQRVESDVALDREKNKRSELSEVSIATAYAYRGEIDQAFSWLEKAVAARDGALGHKLEHEPLLAPLRSDPRYLRLLRYMHLKK